MVREGLHTDAVVVLSPQALAGLPDGRVPLPELVKGEAVGAGDSVVSITSLNRPVPVPTVGHDAALGRPRCHGACGGRVRHRGGGGGGGGGARDGYAVVVLGPETVALSTDCRVPLVKLVERDTVLIGYGPVKVPGNGEVEFVAVGDHTRPGRGRGRGRRGAGARSGRGGGGGGDWLAAWDRYAVVIFGPKTTAFGAHARVLFVKLVERDTVLLGYGPVEVPGNGEVEFVAVGDGTLAHRGRGRGRRGAGARSAATIAWRSRRRDGLAAVDLDAVRVADLDAAAVLLDRRVLLVVRITHFLLVYTQIP